MIQIAFSVHDKVGSYSKFVGAAICSVLENTKESVGIHLLHDETLTDENKYRFEELCRKYRQCIKFYKLEAECFQHVGNVRYFTVGTMLRLYLPNIISTAIDKIIYLDADIIVNLDIKGLWNIDLEEKACAARQYGLDDYWLCKNKLIESHQYFNAGVMIFNLKKIRCQYNLLHQSMTFFDQYNDCQFPDNDALNYIFKEDVTFFAEKYNAFTSLLRKDDIDQKELGVIFHFAGDNPKESGEYYFDKLFWKYLQKTPWGNSTSICNHYMNYVQKQESYNDFLEKMLLKSLHVQKIVIFGAKGTTAASLAIKFQLNKEKDYYVDNNSKLWGKNIDGIKVYSPQILGNEKRENILIVVASMNYYTEIKSELGKMDFKENEDFFDGKILINKIK